MNRKIFFLLCSVIFTLTSIAQEYSYDFAYEGFHYVLSENQESCIIAGSDMGEDIEGKVVIPSEAIFKDKILPVSGIGSLCFTKCKKLVSIEIPNTVTWVGSWAFSGCESLSILEIPETVTVIGANAFENCKNLKSLDIPNSVLEIYGGAFSGCGLTSIKIPNSIKTIEYKTFFGCSNLKSVEIPTSVTNIASQAFAFCGWLDSVTIPESVTEIGDEAFFNTALSSLAIPRSIIKIGMRAFNLWHRDPADSLKEIRCEADIPPTIYSDTFDWADWRNTTLLVPEMSIEAYKNADYWKEFFKIQSSSGINEIEDNNISNKIDYNLPYDIYNLEGKKLCFPLNNLDSGIYIIRQNNKTKKIVINN